MTTERMDGTGVGTVFFFNDTATTEIYTLSLHDALPISPVWPPAVGPPEGLAERVRGLPEPPLAAGSGALRFRQELAGSRSEEHTSELQSRQYLVCRLLLEKKTFAYTVTGYALFMSPPPR